MQPAIKTMTTRRIIPLLVGLIIVLCNAEAQIRIVDANDGSPIAAASLFDNKNNMVGFTWSDGVISNVPETAYPLNVRCMGYEPITIDTPKEQTWRMNTMSYGLDEIVIEPVQRNIMKQTFYAREYFSMIVDKDTISFFHERMAQRFISTSKDSKFKGDTNIDILNSRSYTYQNINKENSNLNDAVLELPSLLEIVFLDDETLYAPESFIKSSTETKYHQEKGKHGVAVVMRQNKNTFSCMNDALADKKEHSWNPAVLKLIGLNLDVTQLYQSQGYRINEEGVYEPKDLNEAVLVMDAAGKGRVFRKLFKTDQTVSIRIMVELYVTDREYLSIEEAKEEQKNPPTTIPFVVPTSAPPLNAFTLQMVKQTNAQSDRL